MEIDRRFSTSANARSTDSLIRATTERSNAGDEIDDDELEAELDGLSDLEDMEEPDYLEANDMPVVNAQETVTDNNADAGEKETDDFGLPVAAQ